MDAPTPKKKRRLSARGCKEKGSVYERELATFFNDHIFPGHDPDRPPVSRAPLSGSFSVYANTGICDLIGTPMLWVEAKRTENIRPHEFLKQAVNGVIAHKSTDIPVVISRRNNQNTGDSLCLLRLSDFMNLYRLALIQAGFIRPSSHPGPATPPPAPTLASLNEKVSQPSVTPPSDTHTPDPLSSDVV